MIWKSHNLVTGVAVFALTENIFATACAVQGSVLPDALEFLFPRKLIRHRGITHWWPIYCVPLASMYWWFHVQGIPPLITLSEAWNLLQTIPLIPLAKLALINYFFWVFIGAVMHILEDTLTGYIPVLTPHDERKIHIFFYPGSPKEYSFDIVFCLCVAFLKYAQLRGVF